MTGRHGPQFNMPVSITYQFNIAHVSSYVLCTDQMNYFFMFLGIVLSYIKLSNYIALNRIRRSLYFPAPAPRHDWGAFQVVEINFCGNFFFQNHFLPTQSPKRGGGWMSNIYIFTFMVQPCEEGCRSVHF